MRTYDSFYINGRWQTPASHERLDVFSASTEEPIGSIAAGAPADVDRAVAAARRAFESWSATTPPERAAWLTRLADRLDQLKQTLATVISQEVGTPVTPAMGLQVGAPILVTRSFADLAAAWPFERRIGHSVILREPIGVAGAITPWNFPLQQIMAKVAAALAAGCTMVLKPSELAPLNACLLAEACEQIDMPAGVLNIVQGTGPLVGEAIAAHPDIDIVSFTGSIRSGRRVAALAADTIKKVTLELGGKSACLILDDAPFDKAVTTGVKNAMLNSGQTCSAWTRMIVPRARMNDVVDLAKQALATLPVGDPLDPKTRLGPLISEPQRQRVEGYIAKGRGEGARLVAGGGRPTALTKGHYVEPTVFVDVQPHMTIAREEIFGPVLAVLPYDSEVDAIAIANDSIYGLSGAVWSADLDHAMQVARRIRTGQVDINGARWNPLAPFGGYKLSGLGREYGEFGLEEYLQVKAIAKPEPKPDK
jgi:acyl-CoA reductase-like NAD-dependent aldehyde dehydrogenase